MAALIAEARKQYHKSLLENDIFHRANTDCPQFLVICMIKIKRRFSRLPIARNSRKHSVAALG